MYERQAVVRLIQMVEGGIVKLGKAAGVEIVGTYKLEDIEAALDDVAKNSGFGKEVLLDP
jgi:hypothetical protein